MPTSSAMRLRGYSGRVRPDAWSRGARPSAWICFCSETSARCWSDLTAPSVFPRIVAASAFEKLKTNFSVSTCCCSGESEPSAELVAFQSIGRQSMLELIEGLSQEQKQVLTLKFVFNLPNAEVATILGKTEGAVKSLQHRALVSLQKQLQSA